MSDMTGGRYFRATDTESLNSIYKTINELETINQEQATIRPQKEYYPWFVGFALVLCFSWLVRKADLKLKVSSVMPNREALKP